MRDVVKAEQIATEVKEKGGRAYYVGGYVRDHIMGIENKDIDLEVHGIDESVLESILSKTGNVFEAGKSFGVYKLGGYDIDIALPRRERAFGTGHKDFHIDKDPHIGTYEAAKRRDFTVNALMEDVLSGEIIDHFNGIEDIESRILKCVDKETFLEDPLRVLRGAQFAARYGFSMDNDTLELCKEIDISSLSKERVLGEMNKAVMKGEKPSVFFNLLKEMNHLNIWFPELRDLIGIEQNPTHHKEGDVWNHTMMVLDEAVKFRDKVENPAGFMMGCICHDFGKAISTSRVNGKIVSYNHEKTGIEPAEEFISRLTNDKKLKKYALNLVRYHMAPNIQAHEKASIKATNRMFDKADDPLALIYIAMADSRGKIGDYEYVSYDDFLFDRLKVYNEYMARPYVTGADIIREGINPGEDFNEALALAHKLRLAGIDKDIALKQVVGELKKARKDNAI